MVDYNEMKQRLMGLVYKLDEIENLEVGHDRDKAVKDFCDILMSVDHDLTCNFIDELLRTRGLDDK
ncbi:hypothetical protein [Vibrio marisflavi]|uniref:Uncharacterized protein n=1 Tax=Vibrio marisflavi CECT 7928 TaxID=634439 RepID=A0ABM9A0I3_9VIBR|nr:hypothetical protein [Vibrio marisflavi]CAH0536841.1 hypothetical protein VMF7928_00732 [Vibrio marisflavi CECT 7928]CAH0539812.1 hypothetical protein VMF7928_02469 [Vibrio marisflavi CECT 7928]